MAFTESADSLAVDTRRLQAINISYFASWIDACTAVETPPLFLWHEPRARTRVACFTVSGDGVSLRCRRHVTIVREQRRALESLLGALHSERMTHVLMTNGQALEL